MNKFIPIVTFAIGFVAGVLTTRALVRKNMKFNSADDVFSDFDCGEWHFESAEDANVVAERLAQIVVERGYATMADMCRLTDAKTVPMSASYGWRKLTENDIIIIADDNGWVMKFPPLENLQDAQGDEVEEYVGLTQNYDTESEEEPMQIEVHKPYVISPEDFMSREDDGYKAGTYYLYEDGVITDDADNIIDNVREVFGIPFSEICRHFGEYDDNAVYFRNDKLATDSEILRAGTEFHIVEVK